MTSEDLLAICRAQGITLEIVEDRLRCRAPKGVLTPELQWTLSTHKAALVDALRQEQQEERLAIMAADDLHPAPLQLHDSLEVGRIPPRCRDEGRIAHRYVRREGCLWCVQCLRRGGCD